VKPAERAAEEVRGRIVAAGTALDGALVRLLHRGRNAVLVQVIEAAGAPDRVGERLTVGDTAFKEAAFPGPLKETR